MKKIVIMAVVIHCLFAIVFVSYSMAVIYKYVDKDGNLCFADDLQVIPKQYRAAALIVQEESKDEPAKARIPAAADSGREQSISTTAQDIPQKHAVLSFSDRLMISGCIIIGTILVIYILRNQAALKKNEKLTSIICNALIVITSLYLVIAHVKDAITVVGLAGNSLGNVQQQSAEKGRKAAQAIKKLDALFENAQKTEEGEN